MREQLELGCVPFKEDCKQVGRDSLDEIKKEVWEYKRFLEKLFPIPDNLKDMGVIYRLKACPHDFGTYYEVILSFPSDNELAWSFALNVENNLPANWS